MKKKILMSVHVLLLIGVCMAIPALFPMWVSQGLIILLLLVLFSLLDKNGAI